MRDARMQSENEAAYRIDTPNSCSYYNIRRVLNHYKNKLNGNAPRECWLYCTRDKKDIITMKQKPCVYVVSSEAALPTHKYI